MSCEVLIALSNICLLSEKYYITLIILDPLPSKLQDILQYTREISTTEMTPAYTSTTHNIVQNTSTTERTKCKTDSNQGGLHPLCLIIGVIIGSIISMSIMLIIITIIHLRKK